MPEENSFGSFGPLYTEHLMLSASFANGTKVLRYELESLDAPDPANATFLCDLTHARLTLFSGPDAVAFSCAAFAGSKLEVGECRFEVALTGDGGITSIPLLARTGTSEYVTFDASPRADVMDAWLSFLRSISKDGYEPYAQMSKQDVTASHALLLLGGKDAKAVLTDYVGEQALPKKGHVASCALDRIPAIVACLPATASPHYLLMVPPHTAVPLWRSLLSFTEVDPVGTTAALAILASQYAWMDLLSSTNKLHLSASRLLELGLVRKDPDFVGARALFDSRA